MKRAIFVRTIGEFNALPKPNCEHKRKLVSISTQKAGDFIYESFVYSCGCEGYRFIKFREAHENLQKAKG